MPRFFVFVYSLHLCRSPLYRRHSLGRHKNKSDGKDPGHIVTVKQLNPQASHTTRGGALLMRPTAAAPFGPAIDLVLEITIMMDQ